jgi:excinuclease ABC subunit C
LQRLRDEAHRFANTYQSKSSRKRLLSSELDGIPGVGAARRTALLSHFGSVTRVRSATVEEIAEVPGIGTHLASVIAEHLLSRQAAEGAPREPS